MQAMHPVELLIYVLIFGGIFGLVLYGFGRAIWDMRRPKRDKPDAVPSRETPGSILFGIAAGLFLLWLSGSLFFGALGFDTGFR